MSKETSNNNVWSICLSSDLRTFDPYDIWKTKIGIFVKRIFYYNRLLGSIPALAFSCWDLFLNNSWRIGYQKQEYPIVRALAAKSLLNRYLVSGDKNLIFWATQHINWLIDNYSQGYSGFCWGANMQWASKNGVYSSNTPYITNTPYILETLVQYQKITNSNNYQSVILSIYNFINKDLFRHIDTEDILCISYAPIKEPRIVINANSYALYSLSLLYSYYPEKSQSFLKDILRLFKFIENNQNDDGSWWYYADKKHGNFIDCFHTCFILKNIIKSSKYITFPINLAQIVNKGYSYLLNNFYDIDYGLFKRFSKTDKLDLIKFDLYDNAEMLNLAYLLNDMDLFKSLEKSIRKHFIRNNDIFSVIDLFGRRRNKNMLRWATMPYIYALSNYE
jgi:hypothetical protein